jgi:predicted dehydrogenase
MTDLSVRVALIGYGYWGPNYARVLHELPESRLVAVCEVNPGKLQQALGRYPHIEGYTDVKEILRRKDVDAVIISTPASTHFELAQAALKTGRHVLVEKPMALTLKHAEKLCNLSERTGCILMVGYTFLYNAGIRKMKECMSPRDFGRIYYLHATRTNLGPIRQDVNAVWDLAPHDISIFNYLLDQQPQWASAVGTRMLNNMREDIAFITLGYAQDVIANIHVSWADPNKVREVVAVGSRRRVIFDDLNNLERVRIFERGVSVGESVAESYGEFKLLVRDGDIISPKIEPSEPLKNQCIDFITAITMNKKPFSDCRLGYKIVQTLVAIEKSLQKQGLAVPIKSEG